MRYEYTISPQIKDGEAFDYELHEALKLASMQDHEILHSSFNANWIKECNINPKVILDIGSYDGGDAIRLKHKFPEANVYSFEGDPARINLIEKYIKKFDVNFIPLAVSDHNGESQFYQSFVDGQALGQGSLLKHTDLYKSIYPHIKQEQDPITVKCISIDSFCKENKIDEVDVAHIDVEGAEWYVLNGMGSIKPKMIFLETIINKGEKRGWLGSFSADKDIHDMLTEMGYSLIKDIISDRLYIKE